jgi:hypothetical protein
MRVHFSQPAMPGRGMPGIQHIPLLTLTAPMVPPPAPMMPPPAPMEARGAPASPEPKRKLLTFRDHGGHEEMLVRSGNSMYCVRRDELMCFYDLPLLDAMRILGVGRCTLRRVKAWGGLKAWPYDSLMKNHFGCWVSEIRARRTAAIAEVEAALRAPGGPTRLSGDGRNQALLDVLREAERFGMAYWEARKPVREAARPVQVRVQLLRKEARGKITTDTEASALFCGGDSTDGISTCGISTDGKATGWISTQSGSTARNSTDEKATDGISTPSDSTARNSTARNSTARNSTARNSTDGNSTGISTRGIPVLPPAPLLAPTHFIVPWDCAKERWLAPDGPASYAPLDTPWPSLGLTPGQYYMQELMGRWAPFYPSRRPPAPPPPEPIPAWVSEMADSLLS